METSEKSGAGVLPTGVAPGASSLRRDEPLMGQTKLTESLSKERILRSLQGVASWMERSAQMTGKVGKSHRIAIYTFDREVSWLYPNSNTAESIGAWLDLAQLLERPELVANAEQYAATLVEDKVHGIYDGPASEARGLMWYWTDIGSYNTLYSMRVPSQFMRLYALNGEQRYLDACDMIGEVMLANQEASGIVGAGWSPKNGWAESGTRVGSRFMYVIGTFAKIWELTGAEKYRDAYERAVTGLLKMQNADGSFYQHYEPKTLERSQSDSSIKCMFFSYLLNGMAEAYSVFKDQRLIVCACKMADFIVKTYYCRSTLPYCIGTEFLPGDKPEANMACFECANGLLWLYEQVGDERYLDIATRLWLSARLNQAERPDEPDIHGAILIGSDLMSRGIDAKDSGLRSHLRYSDERAAKCVLWCMVNHVFASRRLLSHLTRTYDNADPSPPHLLDR